MNLETWLNDNLSALRGQQLERDLSPLQSVGGRFTVPDGVVLNFASNDYLDLARHPHVIQRAREALEAIGAGATASRLVAGTLDIHSELERRLATLKGTEACLVFGSGYLANAGAIPALIGRDDVVLVDRLAHASLIDAAVLSRAKLVRFHHNDLEHLAACLARHDSARRMILTESVFSMDGDLAPLAPMAALAEEHDAMLLVDEAHATGVYGPSGSGLVSEAKLQGPVCASIFTLSKALGGYGGAVACSDRMKRWLANRARGFIFTTALPPAVIGAALGALDVMEREPDLGRLLLARADVLRALLQERGLDTLGSTSQILPIKVGDNAGAVAIARRLRARNILVAAIRPPTVPAGTARLRLSLTLAHTEDDLRVAADAVADACRIEGLS